MEEYGAPIDYRLALNTATQAVQADQDREYTKALYEYTLAVFLIERCIAGNVRPHARDRDTVMVAAYKRRMRQIEKLIRRQ